MTLVKSPSNFLSWSSIQKTENNSSGGHVNATLSVTVISMRVLFKAEEKIKRRGEREGEGVKSVCISLMLSIPHAHKAV